MYDELGLFGGKPVSVWSYFMRFPVMETLRRTTRRITIDEYKDAIYLRITGQRPCIVFDSPAKQILDSATYSHMRWLAMRHRFNTEMMGAPEWLRCAVAQSLDTPLYLAHGVYPGQTISVHYDGNVGEGFADDVTLGGKGRYYNDRADIAISAFRCGRGLRESDGLK